MARKPQSESTYLCPMLRKPQCEVCHTCAFYIHVRGEDKNTGKDIDHWGCVIEFLPPLLIENSQQQRQTGAAVESFRNEAVRKADEQIKAGAVFARATVEAIASAPPKHNLLEAK